LRRTVVVDAVALASGLTSASVLASALVRPRAPPIRFGRCSLDVTSRVLFHNGAEVPLTSAEFAVLFALVSRPGQTLSRERLARLARGRGVGLHDRSIDMQVSRLRKLVETEPSRPRYLRTVWGAGYSFVPDGADRPGAADARDRADAQDSTDARGPADARGTTHTPGLPNAPNGSNP
jgi:DNA-binding winged helix-turn-helix (wHTH) protein